MFAQSAPSRPAVCYWPLGDFEVEVHYKAIRHAYVRIYPPLGQVRLSVPLKTSNLRVQQILEARLAWICQQRRRLTLPPSAEGYSAAVGARPLFVEGAQHVFWGQLYRARLHPQAASSRLWLQDGDVHMQWAAGISEEGKKRYLLDFQRQLLSLHVPRLLEMWQTRLGVQATGWRIRQMRTRWGSCNTRAKRINLAASLVEWPVECLEFVLVHELLHLLEPRHNVRFYQLMDAALPDWRRQHRWLKFQPLEFVHANQHTEAAVV